MGTVSFHISLLVLFPRFSIHTELVPSDQGSYKSLKALGSGCMKPAVYLLGFSTHVYQGEDFLDNLDTTETLETPSIRRFHWADWGLGMSLAVDPLVDGAGAPRH
jgi:hypothetical protein